MRSDERRPSGTASPPAGPKSDLRRNDDRFRELVENGPDVIYRYRLTEPRGFDYVSPSVGAMTGYSPDEYYADPDLGWSTVHPDDRSLVEQMLEKDVTAEPLTVRRIRKDGVVVWTELRKVVIRDEGGTPVAIEGIVSDVTERRRLEEQFRQAQKMEAVGRLAGGIAHDFNNILMAIAGYSELLLSDLDPHDDRRRDVEEIKKAADRAASLTRQLLAFSRQQVLLPRVIDLRAIVTGLEPMLRRVLGEDVQLAIGAPSDAGSVKADPGQIEQVLMNLAVNARDAMPEGGTLTIEIANTELDEQYVRQHPVVRPGAYVLLAVSDSGIGMDAEVQAHLFEPFFTTKEKGQGTGLGLATVYGIVKQSGGYIWAYSEPGHGSTFKMYLPRIDAATDAARRAPRRTRSLHGHETILLVEDEDAVRALVREVLVRHGYTVLEARQGDAGLVIVLEHAGPIHLVITDVVMPHMSGRELVLRLTRARPGVKALYMSGYADHAIFRNGILEPGTAFLQKPFTPAALAHKVREVLDE